jgi:glycine/D-amino acid oxidase-like deaminating enzyme/nitrite reductase/ring-hydroxylating ferredoxin subunit
MESKFPSLWLETSPQTNYPSLESDLDADVLVVGGGMAGLMTAYFLQQAGRKVTLVEADRIAAATTGNTTAKATVLHGAKYHFLLEKFGQNQAALYLESNRWAIDALEDLVTTEKIDCDFQRVAGYLYTASDQQLDLLRKEYEALRLIGGRVELHSQLSGLPYDILLALQIPNQAVFHPRKFLLALADRLVKRGLQIYEKTRVTDIADGSPCTVHAGTHQIHAQAVVIATNYPINERGWLVFKLDQRRSYALAITTSDDVSDDLFIGMTEDEVTVRTYRDQGKRWVIIGGQSHPSGAVANTLAKNKQLHKETERLFTVSSIDYQWSSQDASSVDRVPLTGIVPGKQHLFMTTGYGEWGMTSSIWSGNLLADLITDKPNASKQFYDPSRFNLSASITKSVEVGKHVIKGMAEHGMIEHSLDLSSIQPGEGRVVTHGGKKIAVCRSAAGELCALSAVCTHMGCVVEWNVAEETWDCPCHGSRFARNGSVIRGPAVQPLPQLDSEL